MDTGWELIDLRELGIVRARGVDAARFLQGQLSNDITQLSVQRSQLTGYHNPQGRVIALLRLIQFDSDDIIAMLPRELAGSVATRLSKFILRAKVKIVDDSANWRVSGLMATGPVAPADPAVAPELHSQLRVDDSVFVRIANDRVVLISPANKTLSVKAVPGSDDRWRICDVAAGLPQVFASTSEEFVAQMLNLDVLGAIAFDKGCYTGQEVVARAHYRGRVKRRMQRFVSRQVCRVAPGDSGQLEDGRTFKVVLAAQRPDGRCDFLAVAAAQAGETTTANELAPPAEPAAADILDAVSAPLPYALPD